jgi:hypothetical protein
VSSYTSGCATVTSARTVDGAEEAAVRDDEGGTGMHGEGRQKDEDSVDEQPVAVEEGSMGIDRMLAALRK